MIILGLNSLHGDSSAALIKDGVLVAAAEALPANQALGRFPVTIDRLLHAGSRNQARRCPAHRTQPEQPLQRGAQTRLSDAARPRLELGGHRVRWIFNKEADAAGIRIRILALAHSPYGVDDWWRQAEGVLVFQNEIIKYVYYRTRY